MSATANAQRGRPRKFNATEALGAALRVFWKRGYEGASLKELTEAMGIARPSLYACYGNKEALFRKALDLYEHEKLAYVRTALEAPTAREVAQRLLDGAVAMQIDAAEPKGCLGVISSVAHSIEADSIRSEVIVRRAISEMALVERFERAKVEGDLPVGTEPGALARYLGAVIQGLSVQGSGGMSCEDLRSVVDTVLQLWPGR